MVLVASSITRIRANINIVSTLEITLTKIVVLFFLIVDLIRLIITTIFYKKIHIVVNIFGQKDAPLPWGALTFFTNFCQLYGIRKSVPLELLHVQYVVPNTFIRKKIDIGFVTL
jgi:hypothetical protein